MKKELKKKNKIKLTKKERNKWATEVVCRYLANMEYHDMGIENGYFPDESPEVYADANWESFLEFSVMLIELIDQARKIK